MGEEKYKKVLTIVLVIIIVAIVGLLGYFAYDYINAFITSKNASEFVDDYEKDIPLTVVKNNENDQEGRNSTEGEENNSETGTYSRNRGISTYPGSSLSVLGTISIPKTNCKYAIFQEQTQTALNRGVSMLYGVGLNQQGNTVIIGHNYRNGQFFSNNKRLEEGDKIYITDYNGTKLSYTIYEIFRATPEDASFYTRDTEGNIEITLSTCTDDNKERLIILARAD